MGWLSISTIVKYLVIKSILLDCGHPSPKITSVMASTLITASNAFPDLRPGKIWVKFYQDGEGTVHLNFKDNGVGLPKDFYWEGISSFGMKLIHLLAKQLDGKLEIHSDCGTEFHLTFTTLC